MLRQLLISNKAQCRACQEIIESTHVHDYRSCKCGLISVDGGLEYLRRLATEDNLIELSESINLDENRFKKIQALLWEAAEDFMSPSATPRAVTSTKYKGMRDLLEAFGISDTGRLQ